MTPKSVHSFRYFYFTFLNEIWKLQLVKVSLSHKRFIEILNWKAKNMLTLQRGIQLAYFHIMPQDIYIPENGKKLCEPFLISDLISGKYRISNLWKTDLNEVHSEIIVVCLLRSHFVNIDNEFKVDRRLIIPNLITVCSNVINTLR